MNHPVQKVMAWMRKPDYKDPDRNLSALYVQAISFLIIISSFILAAVYLFEKQFFYVYMTVMEVFVYGAVISLARSGKLRTASNLFLISALVLLSFGVFVSGGIHSSSSLLFPVILVFASLLLDRRVFILYGALCIASIGFIIFAENQGLTPVPYVPDPPNFPLFLTYSLVIITAGIVVRSITESLQNSSITARQYAQEIYTQKSMLDRVGQAVVGCKLDNAIIYWNQAAVDLYGWTVEDALGEKYYDLVPTNLTPDTEEVIRMTLGNGETWNGELVFRNKDGDELHVLGTIAPLRDEQGGITGWIGIAADFTERRNIELELRRREEILQAVTFAAEKFLKSSDWSENIDDVLERLGRSINATHAYLFEDHVNAKGEPVTSMRHEWTAPGYPSDLDSPYFKSSPIQQDGFEEQVEKLRHGEVRVGNLSTFNQIEKEIMSEQGVKAILEVPIFVNGREWGAIGFDDFENERKWTPAEVDVLKVAAGILSGTIQRQEVEATISESERVYRQAIQASGAIPYYLDYVEYRYTFMGEGIEELTGYSPSEITPQKWDSMELERYPRGNMADLTYDEADQLTEDGVLHHWECDYLILNQYGQKRWVSDSSVHVLNENGVRVGVVGILQDITDRKLTEANLRKRESILQAVTFSAEQFLKTPDWRMSINAVLERLGREFNASHAYLFESHQEPGGPLLRSMRYEWVAPGQQSDLDKPEYQNATEHENEFKRYYAILNTGEPYIGDNSSFTDEEKKQFSKFGICAILELRILVDGKQWGVLGFDDMVNEREWTPMEVDVIKLATGVLEAAIKRQVDEDALKHELAERRRAEAALKFSESKFSKAFHTTHVLTTIEDENHVLVDVNNAFLDTLGFDRDQVIGRSVSDLNILFDADDLQALRQANQNGGRLKDYEMRVRLKSGEAGYVLLSSDRIKVDDSEFTLTSGLDITDRKLAEMQIQQHAARAEVLASLSHVLSQASQDYRLMLDTVVRRCAELIGDGASIFLYSPENEFLELVAVYNPDPNAMQVFWDEIDKRPIRWNEGNYAKVIGEKQPVLIPFIDADELARQASPERREYYTRIPFHSMMLAPLHVQGRVMGVIGMARHSPGRYYTSDDLTFLQDIADRSALAMLNAQYYQELEQELAERKRTEQALLFSEQKFFQAFHTTPVLMTLEDDGEHFVEVNDAFVETLGYTHEELIGHRPREFNLIPFPEDQIALRESMEEKGIINDVEIRIRGKFGRIFTVVMSVEYFFVNDDRYILTSALDISDRKLAEEKYRNIFNNSIDGIFQSTVDGRFVSVNAAMARIYGYESPDDMLHNVNDIGAQLYVDNEKRNEVRRRLNTGEKLTGYENLDYRKDGSTFWSSMNAQAIFDENGKVLYYEGTVEDITPRKKAEAEREELIAELESKNTELEQFTYTVSHDLKSPLVTISGFLGYLEEDTASGNMERLKRDTQRIREAVFKMQKLLNELLELSRIGRIMNPPRAVPFIDLVQDAAEIVRGRLDEQNVTLQTQPNLPTVHVDRPRLTEVLQNLLDNAAKYMGDQPSPQIEIGQGGQDKQTGYPIFYVKDNGIGIAPEHHERVFGLFNKLDVKTEGTGVGLALVKRIIETHGCRIWVESELGKGSTCYVTLPTKPETDSGL